LLGKQNAERIVKRPMKLPMHGGTLPKPTREVTLTVSQPGIDCDCRSSMCALVAIQALGMTIAQLTKSGRFRQAADREKEIGQIWLQENNDLRKACESYERAGDWYAQEDATA
jgi:hypothetical protein